MPKKRSSPYSKLNKKTVQRHGSGNGLLTSTGADIAFTFQSRAQEELAVKSLASMEGGQSDFRTGVVIVACGYSSKNA